MRILVISDSRRSKAVIDRILLREPTAKDVFFLGDVTEDIEDYKYEYTDRVFRIVSGNCDPFSTIPSSAVDEVAGQRIFYTHGHLFGVKYSTDRLLSQAKERGCNIVLFGHTHIACAEYKDGIYLVNPGSCSRPRNSLPSYAVIDILPSGILPQIKNV